MEGHLAHFLKEIGALRVIENKFEDYLENVKDKGTEYVCSAIVVPLKYEYSTFTKDFQSLLHFLILNPLYYENILRNFILKFVNIKLEKMSLPLKIQLEQIHFVHRFERLPMMDKYKFFPKIQKSLSNFTCTVAGRGELKMYTRQTVWFCEGKCTPSVVASEEPKCDECAKTMKEFVPLRDMSDHMKLIVFPLEMVQTPRRMETVYQKFDVILRDNLANFEVVYGNAYVITGIYDGIERAFYAWNIAEKADA